MIIRNPHNTPIFGMASKCLDQLISGDLPINSFIRDNKTGWLRWIDGSSLHIEFKDGNYYLMPIAYLNLVTPLFRSGMLSKIKESIPDHPDINWIVVLCDERDILKKECQDLNIPFLTIPDPEGQLSIPKKINKGIKHLKPGFFQGIDDDTIFNPNSYEAFKRYQSTHKLIIGQQRLKDGTIREAQKPKHCYTDGAQGLIHTDLLKTIRLGCFSTDPVADCNFLLECWEACPAEQRLILPEIITNYNFLR